MIASTQTNHPLASVADITAPQTSIQTVEEACSRMKALGLRITKPRVVILTTLFAEQDPISIETLHHKIQNQACDLVTVYRCLSVFTELGLVRRSFAINGTSLYEINRGGDFLFRVTCKSTQKRETLSAEVSAELMRSINKAKAELERRGYVDFAFSVELFANSPASLQSGDSLPAVIAKRSSQESLSR